MKDLNLSRLINTMACGSLVLSAVGCGGKKKDDGPERVEPEDAAERACTTQQQCNLADFDAEFASLQECEEYLIERYDYALEEYGEGCAQAGAALYDCYGTAYAKDCDVQDVYDDCTGELLRFYNECYE